MYCFVSGVRVVKIFIQFICIIQITFIGSFAYTMVRREPVVEVFYGLVVGHIVVQSCNRAVCSITDVLNTN